MRRSYLSSSVDDLGGILLALVLDNSREGVFDGGIVRFDEVILDKLHRKRRLPYIKSRAISYSSPLVGGDLGIVRERRSGT